MRICYFFCLTITFLYSIILYITIYNIWSLYNEKTQENTCPGLFGAGTAKNYWSFVQVQRKVQGCHHPLMYL